MDFIIWTSDYYCHGVRKMKQKKKYRSVIGNILIVMGLLLFAAALTLVIYNVWDGKRAEHASTAIVEKLEEVIPDDIETPEEVIVPEGLEPEIDPTMPTEMIDGYAYIGTLKIPSLGLKVREAISSPPGTEIITSKPPS